MRFSLRRIEAGTPALTELQALHVRCAQFVEETTGHSPRDDEAARLLAILPPGMNLGDKQVLGLHRDGEMVGVVDLLRGHPGPTDWYIGLLLISPEARGVGLGTAVVEEIVRRVVAEGGRALHLIVREDNPRALAFYLRHGFDVIDRRVQDLGSRKNLVFKMVRSL
ncbi:MAG TPA: GNAT family N-acetyltransferase [Polyangia bacterium]|nr:GNAT family N-acetyltransferase [Polyangia bacterium]